MKKQLLKLVLPLSILLFFGVSKWWYAFPVDGPDTMYKGFPLVYVGEGWHTSGSIQFFLVEFIADFLIYVPVCSILAAAITRINPQFRFKKWMSIVLWSMVGLVLSAEIFLFSISNPAIKLHRSYELKVQETGVQIWWIEPNRPEPKVHR